MQTRSPSDATLCLLKTCNLLLLHDSLHGFHHIPCTGRFHGTFLLEGCLTGLLLLSVTPIRLDNTIRLRHYGAEIHCGLALDGFVVALSHVKDDKLMPIATEFAEVERKVAEPRENLLAYAGVHTLDDFAKLLAATCSLSNKHYIHNHYSH